MADPAAFKRIGCQLEVWSLHTCGYRTRNTAFDAERDVAATAIPHEPPVRLMGRIQRHYRRHFARVQPYHRLYDLGITGQTLSAQVFRSPVHPNQLVLVESM
jgi:hypothetical protein